MSKLRTWRVNRGWTQEDLGKSLGLSSKGQVSQIESGNGVTIDIAIRIDRLTKGAVTVADLRPDLNDVRVLTGQAAA